MEGIHPVIAYSTWSRPPDAIAEANAWTKQNTPIPLENVLGDFGLTMADWESMATTPLAEENSKPCG